jgi:hypothetical protein
MRPGPLVSLAALAAALAAPVAAQEGGTIRSGEHADFSRIVMVVDPTTEWTLELGPGTATIAFPGRSIPFSTAGVFDLIPRDRISAVETTTGPDGTAVTVSLACDCRVSTAFVGARYLALDVGDRTASRTPAAAAAQPAPDRTLAAPEPGTDLAGRTVEEALASAERILLEQLRRAADQGLVELAAPIPADTAPDAVAAEPAVAPADATPPLPPAALAPPSPQPVPRPATDAPAAEPAEPPAFASDGDRLLAHLSTTLNEAHSQVRAITVFDRDSAEARAAAARAGEQDAPPVCRPDFSLDVARWSDGRPLFDQAVELRARLVGEFDRPDPDAVGALARLHIRHGLGSEAGAILAGFSVTLEDGPMLADLARLVEERPVAADGPLALGTACPGRHGLWLALAGNPAQLADTASFPGVREALADTPPDLRALIGPALVARYLDAGRVSEARVIHDVMVRPGTALDPAMSLAAGRLAAAENRPVEAEVHLAGLVSRNAPNAPDALLALVRARLDLGDRVPGVWITDLETVALEQRGGPREAAARALIGEALARNGALSEGFAALGALARDIPAAEATVAALTPRLLAAADPATTGAAAYAQAVIDHAWRIAAAPSEDPARIAIARKLLALGLAAPARDLLAPPVDREVTPARLLAAAAEVSLDRPDAALALLQGLDGAEAADLRARALARRGDFAAASDTLVGDGRPGDALPYAWVAGQWTRAAETDDAVRAAMAGYMRDRETVGPPVPAEAAPSPEDAFRAPAPRTDEPSLAGSRRVVETGAAVERFVESLLATE